MHFCKLKPSCMFLKEKRVCPGTLPNKPYLFSLFLSAFNMLTEACQIWNIPLVWSGVYFCICSYLLVVRFAPLAIFGWEVVLFFQLVFSSLVVERCIPGLKTAIPWTATWGWIYKQVSCYNFPCKINFFIALYRKRLLVSKTSWKLYRGQLSRSLP